MKQLLWTIQTEAAYTEFEKSGILVANENHLFCGEDLRFAYDWMAGQMVNRIGAPPPRIRYPVWAWYQWEENGNAGIYVSPVMPKEEPRWYKSHLTQNHVLFFFQTSTHGTQC